MFEKLRIFICRARRTVYTVHTGSSAWGRGGGGGEMKMNFLKHGNISLNLEVLYKDASSVSMEVFFCLVPFPHQARTFMSFSKYEEE